MKIHKEKVILTLKARRFFLYLWVWHSNVRCCNLKSRSDNSFSAALCVQFQPEDGARNLNVRNLKNSRNYKTDAKIFVLILSNEKILQQSELANATQWNYNIAPFWLAAKGIECKASLLHHWCATTKMHTNKSARENCRASACKQKKASALTLIHSRAVLVQPKVRKVSGSFNSRLSLVAEHGNEKPQSI